MKEPTMEEVLELVEFRRDDEGNIFVMNVNGNVHQNIYGHVFGRVCGTINGRSWQCVESPKEKIIRLIREGRGEEAIDVLEISGVCGD